ncbi:MAG: hypothetical protein H0T46_31370 [Deltaproteobacteria bacterium]|nr:hypothetical protein [Deltaproteobacteria bacterium]
MKQLVVLVALSLGCGGGADGGVSIAKVSVADVPQRDPWPPSKKLSLEIATGAAERCTARLLPVPTYGPPEQREILITDGKGYVSMDVSFQYHALVEEIEVTCGEATRKAPLAAGKMSMFRDQSGGPIVRCHGVPCTIDIRTSTDGTTRLATHFDPQLSFDLDGMKAEKSSLGELELKVSPAGGVEKVSTAALTKGLQLPGVLTVRYGKATSSITLEKLVVSVQPMVLDYASKLSRSLAAATPGAGAIVPGRAVLYLTAAGRVSAFGPERPIGSVEYLAVEQFARQTREKRCGTYVGANGQRATYTVFLYDADVIVYDVAAKTVVGKRTFRGTGGCPRSFVSQGGQSGAGGGYAESEDIAAYAASFAKS